jgi:fumarate hydratase subunit alpha
MREINVSEVEELVRDLCIKANLYLPEDMESCIECNAKKEQSPVGKNVFADILDNMRVAREETIPICQDTGMAVIFMTIGQDVHFVGGSLNEAINKGVARGYTEGKLRCSIVSDPLERVNTGDNTPPVVHLKIAEGEKVEIIVAPKGFGSENMSQLKMMTPSVTEDEIVDWVVSVCAKAGSNPCPPIVIGVGIGGDFDIWGFAQLILGNIREACYAVAQKPYGNFFAHCDYYAISVGDLFWLIVETSAQVYDRHYFILVHHCSRHIVGKIRHGSRGLRRYDYFYILKGQ